MRPGIQNLKVSEMNFKKCKTFNQYGKVNPCYRY